MSTATTHTPTPSGPETASGGAPHGRGRTPFWQAVGIVAGREMKVKMASKAFVITTGILLAGVLAAVLLVPRLGDLFGGDDVTSVAVTEQTQASVDALGAGYESTLYPSADAARDAVRAEETRTAVVPDEQSPAGLAVVGLSNPPMDLGQMLSVSPSFEVLDPNAPDPALRYFIALGFGLVFFMVSITYGQQIAVSVIEEKQSRIVEILMTAVPARAMMAGKVIGNSAMAMLQIVLIAGAVLLGMQVNGDVLPLDGLGLPIIWFVLLFAIGFVMIAALYAAAASLVSRQEDVGSASMPVLMLIMIPYFAVIFFNDNPDALRIMSYVPFCAPVAVPLRVFMGQGEQWEHWLAAGILVIATLASIWFAATVYERSILRTGRALKWSEALRSPAKA
ncbi:MAG: ABC transporter permease [Micrococcus sp.]|nr:ABC transporter permease [Micrococcus sp.]